MIYCEAYPGFCLPSCSLKSAGRKEGRQMECAHAHIACPHFYLLHLIFSPCPSLGHLLKKKFHTWEVPILVACPYKKKPSDKACEEHQLGGTNIPPRDVSSPFERGGLDFSSSSHQIPINNS